MSKSVEEEDVAPPKKRYVVRRDTFFHLKDGTLLTLPSPILSQTMVGTYVNCPRKFWFRFVLGIVSPPGVAPTLGTANHTALDENNKHKAKRGWDLKTRVVIDAFKSAWDSLAKTIPTSEWAQSGTNRNHAAESVVPALKNYMEKVAPTIQPIASEKRFQKVWNGLAVRGTADVLEDDKILDYKTCSAQSGYIRPGFADFDLQLAVYAKAFKKERAALLCFVKGTGKVVRCATRVSPARKAAAVEQITHVAKGISAQSFPLCDKSNFLCSPRFCGYWYYCRGAKDGKARHP